MFNQIKPGHILRFGTDPSTIISPPGEANHAVNDNTLATPWTPTSDLGAVQCLSHPSGAIGPIAAAVAKQLRATPATMGRSASYSAVGRLVTDSNRPVGQDTCDFVGYVDGKSNYIVSTRTVFSKDFSGCLMVAYTIAGQRHVAHAAASQVPTMNCKQAFLTTIQGQHAVLIGWFRPFVAATDNGRKANAFGVIGPYVGNNINRLTTFGVVTQANHAYSIDAFKPVVVAGNDWVVTDISPKAMSQSWVAP